MLYSDAVLSSRSAPRTDLLDVRGLRVRFPIRRGAFGRATGYVHAVDGVDLTIRTGETLGLVGGSGCGKTTLGRCIVGTSAQARRDPLPRGRGRVVDLAQLSTGALRPYQRQVRLIFQDPFSSLNRMTLGQIVGDPLRANRIASGSELEDRVADMLTRVGLSPKYMRRYPRLLGWRAPAGQHRAFDPAPGWWWPTSLSPPRRVGPGPDPQPAA